MKGDNNDYTPGDTVVKVDLVPWFGGRLWRATATLWGTEHVWNTKRRPQWGTKNYRHEVELGVYKVSWGRGEGSAASRVREKIVKAKKAELDSRTMGKKKVPTKRSREVYV